MGSTDRAGVVVSAYKEIHGGVYESGRVRIIGMEYTRTPEGTPAIVVHTSTSGDDPITIVNPPHFIEDVDGDAVLAGVKHRYDPLAAVAHAISRAGMA